MNATEFKKVVDSLEFMPGWTIKANHYRHDPSWRVELSATWMGPDSDREYAPRGYDHMVGLQRNEVLHIGGLRDETDAYRTVLDFLVRVLTHEAREFLRVPGQDWEAPFHPHRPETNTRWRDSEDRSVFLTDKVTQG